MKPTEIIKGLQAFIIEVFCRFAANLISDFHGLQSQSEPSGEHALRQALTKHNLIRDSYIQRQIDHAVQNELGNFAAQLQNAICEGMEIECEPEASLKDLFAKINASMRSKEQVEVK